VIDITAFEKDEEICSALLQSAVLPLVFERGTWLGKLALDGGVADLTPLLPALQAGCELIFVIYLNHTETPTSYRARNEVRSRYRWDVCRSLSKIQAVELYKKYCDRFKYAGELFPEPEPPFRLDLAELVFVVPSESLGRTTNFTGGDRAKKLMALGEADMWAELKKHPTLRHLLESPG
jgi:predicted acylesterase/phospholipase RssA